MNKSLFVRDGDSGAYRPAHEREILDAAAEVLGRHVVGEVLQSPRDSMEYLRARLATLEHEVFCCLFLDTRHRVLAFEELFRGTLNGTAVHPREAAKRALAYNAGAVIFAHNHPSGVPEPSRADEVLTQRLKEAFTPLEINVLDHIVVGREGCVSFSERGLL